MRTYRSRFLSVLLIFLLVAPLQAQNLRDPRFMELSKAGFADMYNLDYEKARQAFALLEKEYPDHPAPPLYTASIYWLEEMLRRQDAALNRFLVPAYFWQETKHVMPPRDREAFFQGLNKSEALANAILEKNRSDKDSRYFLATAYGLRASFAVTVDHSLREAFSTGKKAYSLTKKLIEEDPNYHDARLTVGVYEYIAGNIPWVIKWITFFVGVRGNKEQGFAHLKTASEKGQYIKNEAELVLMVFCVRERRYGEALEIARSLHSRFPRNFLFAVNVAQILKLAGKKDQAAAKFIEVERRVEAGEPNFNKLPLPLFRFNVGTELLHMEKLDLAFERFRKCIENPQTPEREQALSHLSLGKILFWSGRKGEAVKECESVLALRDFDESHNQARDLLRRMKESK